jgi:hypothetical protein
VLEPRDLRIMSPLAWLYSKLCWIRKMPGGRLLSSNFPVLLLQNRTLQRLLANRSKPVRSRRYNDKPPTRRDSARLLACASQHRIEQVFDTLRLASSSVGEREEE